MHAVTQHFGLASKAGTWTHIAKHLKRDSFPRSQGRQKFSTVVDVHMTRRTKSFAATSHQQRSAPFRDRITESLAGVDADRIVLWLDEYTLHSRGPRWIRMPIAGRMIQKSCFDGKRIGRSACRQLSDSGLGAESVDAKIRGIAAVRGSRALFLNARTLVARRAGTSQAATAAGVAVTTAALITGQT